MINRYKRNLFFDKKEQTANIFKNINESQKSQYWTKESRHK